MKYHLSLKTIIQMVVVTEIRIFIDRRHFLSFKTSLERACTLRLLLARVVAQNRFALRAANDTFQIKKTTTFCAADERDIMFCKVFCIHPASWICFQSLHLTSDT